MLGRHAIAHGHAGVLPAGLLLLLQVLVVGHLLLLFAGHVARVHGRALAAHAGLLSLLRALGRDLGGVNAILAGRGFGRVEAGLFVST